MAHRDEKGFIRYSPEELNQIPSFEQRDQGTGMQVNAAGGALGALGGAAVGSLLGPAGTVVGGVTGGVLGGAATGRNAGPAGRTGLAGRQTGGGGGQL